jgi:hypothetical protein
VFGEEYSDLLDPYSMRFKWFKCVTKYADARYTIYTHESRKIGCPIK